MKFTIYATIDGQKCEFSCYCDDKVRGELMKNAIVAQLCAWSYVMTDLKVETS